MSNHPRPRDHAIRRCRGPLLRWLAQRVGGSLAYRLGIPHESDYAFFGSLEGPALFVDIGAGTGQSARSLRIFNRDLQIVSFEPNRLLEPELHFTKRLLGAGFEYHLSGLGNRQERLTLYVPVVCETPLSRWATTDRATLERDRSEIEQEAGRPFSVVEVPMEIRRFDELALRPAAVKIDVEGYELEILRGMRETLQRDEPILMIEAGVGAEDIADWLAAIGYRTFEYDVDAHALRETGDLWGTTNYFACTQAVIAGLQESDELRVCLSERVDEASV